MKAMTRPQALTFVHAHLTAGQDARVRPGIVCPVCRGSGGESPVSFWITAKHNPYDAGEMKRWLVAHCRCGACWIAEAWKRGRRRL